MLPVYVIWHFIRYEQRSVRAKIEFELHKYEFIKLALSGWVWMSWIQQFEIESKYLKMNVTIIEINQLTRNYSPIHIQISFIPTGLWAPEHLEETFVLRVTGRQLPPPRLLTVAWHSSLSQLQAMWHRAFLVSSASKQVSFTLAERDANCILWLLILWWKEYSYWFVTLHIKLCPAFLQVHISFLHFWPVIQKITT